MSTRLITRTRSASADPQNPDAEELDRIVHDVRTVAVVGISRDPKKAARRVPSYMAAKGYDLYPVNPYAERILGRQSVADLNAVEAPLDMVQIFRPSAEAGAIMRQAATRPEKPIVWLQEGIRDDEAAGELRAQGITVVQDLCFYKVHRSAHGI